MKNWTDEEMMDMWRDGNNSGIGFAAGEEHHNPADAAAAEGYTEIESISPEGNVACKNSNETIVICDSHGPWAVRIDN